MNRPAARRPTGGRAVRGREQTRGRGAAVDPAARRARRPEEGAVRPEEAAGTPRKPRKGSGRPDEVAGGKGRKGSGWEGAGRVARARSAADPPGPTDRPQAAGGRRFSLRRRRAAPAPPRGPVPARFRRRRLVAGLTAAVVLFVGVGLGSRLLLYDLGLANVRDVTVTGLATVPEQAVRDAAAVPTGGPLIAVDTDGAARRVAAVEGVASVEVRRAWPHTVEIRVTERVPVALWQGPQGLLEVDGTGLPYRRAPAPPPGLPRLAFAGVAPGDPATMAALSVLAVLTDPVRPQVATVEAAGIQVTLGLTDDRTVRWGGPERTADKVAVLGPLLGQPGSVYDISSPDLPTVRR